jgi:hypothetical protein
MILPREKMKSFILKSLILFLLNNLLSVLSSQADLSSATVTPEGDVKTFDSNGRSSHGRTCYRNSFSFCRPLPPFDNSLSIEPARLFGVVAYSIHHSIGLYS